MVRRGESEQGTSRGRALPRRQWHGRKREQVPALHMRLRLPVAAWERGVRGNTKTISSTRTQGIGDRRSELGDRGRANWVFACGVGQKAGTSSRTPYAASPAGCGVGERCSRNGSAWRERTRYVAGKSTAETAVAREKAGTSSRTPYAASPAGCGVGERCSRNGSAWRERARYDAGKSTAETAVARERGVRGMVPPIAYVIISGKKLAAYCAVPVVAMLWRVGHNAGMGHGPAEDPGRGRLF